MAGVIGQVHISPHEHLHEMCVSPVWGSPTEATQGALPSTVVMTLRKADGDALKRRVQGNAPVEVTLHAEVETRWRKTPILVAELPGPDEAEPFVMFSGHHDTWYYGVMDNGGANATMLEIARLFAPERAAWRRGLRLCFWSGHSHGRYSGSAWYADQYWEELERRCVAHVNVDSTGGVGASVLGHTASMSVLHALAAEAIGAAGQDYIGKRKNRSSDDSFGGIGIPSMFGALSEQPPSSAPATRNNLGWWWHTPEDTIDKIDEEYLIRDTRVVLFVTRRLADDAVLPLDVAAEARDLAAELTKLRPMLSGRVDVDDLLARAEAVAAAASAAQSGGGHAELINHALLRATRALVPIDYSAGDRFEHEPALPVPAWPTLQPLRDLAQAVAGSDEAAFLAVSARRARNRVAFALRQAEAVLRSVA